ncbi:MAG: PEGA domain-containing protein [Kofleriaceae bacterium]
MPSSGSRIPMTRPGYAPAKAGAGVAVSPGTDSALVYPRYEPPPAEPDEPRLRPSRRPLFIAIGVVVIGVTILLAVTIGGSGETVEPRGSASPVAGPVEPPGPSRGSSDAIAALPTPVAVVAAPDAAPEPEPAETDGDESISIKVDSDPPGADVLLSGKSIGTTPLDTKIPRGTGAAYLTIHRARYEDVTTKIDLTGDFEKSVALVPIAEPGSTAVAAREDDAARLEAKKRQESARRAEQKRLEDLRKNEQKRLDQRRQVDTKRVDKKAAPKCQDPGRINPYDSSCNGQPCPPCAE